MASFGNLAARVFTGMSLSYAPGPKLVISASTSSSHDLHTCFKGLLGRTKLKPELSDRLNQQFVRIMKALVEE